MRPPHVLLFGSRDWTDAETIRRRLSRFPPETVVIHGAATGADSIGGLAATSLGFEVIAEPAEWRPGGVYDKAAGPKRNQRMLDLYNPSCGLGFMMGLTPGSMDMLRRLVDAGLPVDLCVRPVGLR